MGHNSIVRKDDVKDGVDDAADGVNDVIDGVDDAVDDVTGNDKN